MDDEPREGVSVAQGHRVCSQKDQHIAISRGDDPGKNANEVLDFQTLTAVGRCVFKTEVKFVLKSTVSKKYRVLLLKCTKK